MVFSVFSRAASSADITAVHQRALALLLQKLWQIRGPHIVVVEVTEQRLESACRARRFLQGIEVERRACLQDVAQVLGGNAHGVEFVATLWVLDIRSQVLRDRHTANNGRKLRKRREATGMRYTHSLSSI